MDVHCILRRTYRLPFRDRVVQWAVMLVVEPLWMNTFTRDTYLNVLKVLRGSRYIYFTSNKSSLTELGKWLGENVGIGNPFEGAELKTRTNHVNPLTTYEDMMLYKLSA